MNRFKGTKGEWHACCKTNLPHFLFAGEGGTVICGFHTKQDDGTELPIKEVQANARLIEASPDLLEALQGFLNLKDIVSYPEFTPQCEHGEAQAVSNALNKAQLAINKALGL